MAKLDRNVSAGVTGVATGVVGTPLIAIAGVTAGVVLQLLEPDNPAVRRFEQVTEGVTDGSAALLGRTLFQRR